MPPVDRRVVHLNLDVPDVYEAYERLREQDVDFVHRPRTVPQGEHLELCSATFRDPDGHVWEVAHNPGFGLNDEGSVVLPPSD